MRVYETLFIVKPDLSQEDAIKVFESFKENITNNGGKIINEEVWGKKTLAYKIQKFSEGYYFLINFEAEPTYPKELERRLKLNESVIRFIVVKIDGKKFKLKKQAPAPEETPKAEEQPAEEKTEE
ncbi:30S ribosomal protein S6 [Deferribacter autotrophicus]|uniref:Small ribosomal subunit protein bS6 n=1 Tax=Deferribacter autotrophicus TaxID=500465 RepID=A0A5A8F770_9BACT|nr:30S ribosomal protein S6 [Deferribacter autotrophicus]KAA0257696.1 30S ribosomal protein S6 [Deferribacter autotrophicus]